MSAAYLVDVLFRAAAELDACADAEPRDEAESRWRADRRERLARQARLCAECFPNHIEFDFDQRGE